MRRRLAVVLVIAVASAIAVAAAVDRTEPRVGSSEQRRYVDRAGWSLAYPRTMQLEGSEASMRLYVSSWANLAARWDRVGRVIKRPAGATIDDPLNVAVAKVAWDGHVLLFPGVARFADARHARRLWPGWQPRP